MTLSPDRIGDKGQRYEIRFCTRADGDDTQVFGRSETLRGAEEMRAAWKEHPSAKYCWIVDRKPPEPVNVCSDMEAFFNAEAAATIDRLKDDMAIARVELAAAVHAAGGTIRVQRGSMEIARDLILTTEIDPRDGAVVLSIKLKPPAKPAG